MQPWHSLRDISQIKKQMQSHCPLISNLGQWNGTMEGKSGFWFETFEPEDTLHRQSWNLWASTTAIASRFVSSLISASAKTLPMMAREQYIQVVGPFRIDVNLLLHRVQENVNWFERRVQSLNFGCTKLFLAFVLTWICLGWSECSRNVCLCQSYFDSIMIVYLDIYMTSVYKSWYRLSRNHFFLFSP